MQKNKHYSAMKKNKIGAFVEIWVGLGEGKGIPLQYSCLENPMDGGAC